MAAFPRQVEILSALGVLCLQSGNIEEGISLLRKSLHINPTQPFALYNLGTEFQKSGNLEEALLCYDKSIKINPYDVEAHLNRGNTLKDLRRFNEALVAYDRAIALKPDFAPAYWNKSITKILLGDDLEGWKLYEWGWKSSERGSIRKFSQPLWLGEELISGKTLLIHSEQGLGDAIQFCRYAPMVSALGARVILEVPSALVTLLSTLEGNITVIEKGGALPAFDLYCPVMSLPLAFKTALTSIPETTPYLRPDHDKLLEWRRRLGEKTRPRIGLAWSGSLTHKNDRNRSIPLNVLEELLKRPFEFHSLQKEIRPEDMNVLSRMQHIHSHQNDLKDFSDTASLAQEMDLVISVDTSVAHLAGALGIPAWVLLPHTPDYRWLLDRDDTPWYPNSTLFRQPSRGDWNSVIKAVSARLKTHF